MNAVSIISAAVLLATLGTFPSRAIEPMQPTSEWIVDFGDAHCTAMRAYGPPDMPITLALKPAPIGDVMQLSVVRAARRSGMDQYPGSIQIDQSAPVAISLLGRPAPDGKLRINTVNLRPKTFMPVRAATTVRLRSSSEIDATFAVSQIDAVTRTLDRCVLNLRRVWHIGEHGAALRQAATSPQKLAALFSSEDFPGIALRHDGTGLVQVMLLINEAGRIASCMVTETSGLASLDAQSCIILTRRARFAPAIGVDGKAAKSGVLTRIRWKG